MTYFNSLHANLLPANFSSSPAAPPEKRSVDPVVS